MSEEKITKVEKLKDKLQLLSQVLEDIDVNVEDFENILDRMINVIADMRKVDSSDRFRFLPMIMIDEQHIEVDSWHANIDLGELNVECVQEKPIYQCLNEFMQNKTRIYEKLMEALAHLLDMAITWISNNRDDIVKLDRIKDEIDEIYKRIEKNEDEEEDP